MIDLPFLRRKTAEPTIAIGLGRYGHPVLRPSSTFRKSSLIVGASRTGKTRLASSIANQITHIHGGGQLVIDFKGDGDLVMRKAQLAEREGRTFLHFELAPRAGGQYERPHPYAPPIPARYDPLARGNAKSKTEMLLKSVSREGNAAIYLQAAQDVTEMCWNVAALSGYDQTVGADGRTRISALETLMNMLAVSGQTSEMASQAQALTIDSVQAHSPGTSDADAEQRIRQIRSRVQTMTQDLANRNSVVSQAAASTRQLVSTYVNSSALYPNTFGTSNSPAGQIDLVRAVLRGEIVVFSLPAQYYQDFAEMIGSMILLDLQNAVATLRAHKAAVAQFYGKTPSVADDTPWPPFVVQIEELGTAANDASAEALINLLNKSADTGLRVIASTQALADIRKIDGTGVWLDQMLGQIDHLFSLQIGAAADDEVIAGFSGQVTKQFAINETDVSNNRFRIGTGASESKRVRGTEQKETRIPLGVAQGLDYSRQQLVYITKAPKLTAVHTTNPEGPNNWYETIEMVPVFEEPYGFDPYDRPAGDVEAANTAAIDAATTLNRQVKTDQMLMSVLGAEPAELDTSSPVAARPGDAGQWDGYDDPPADEQMPPPPEPVDEPPLQDDPLWGDGPGEDNDLWSDDEAPGDPDDLWTA